MNTKLRILSLHLLEKQKRNPQLFEELGIQVSVKSKEKNTDKNLSNSKEK